VAETEELEVAFDSSPLSSSEDEKQLEASAARRTAVLRRMLSKIDVETKLKAGSAPEMCDVEILEWIESLNLKDHRKYIEMFAQHEIDMESLKLMNAEQLKEIGVTAIGTLSKMLHSIEMLKEQDRMPKPPLPKTPSSQPKSQNKETGLANREEKKRPSSAAKKGALIIRPSSAKRSQRVKTSLPKRPASALQTKTKSIGNYSLLLII
jgi:SOS response regulatory protein OraA/RecX